MTARIPPIQCLLTFEALARLRSVTQTADELNVTPSAVSPVPVWQTAKAAGSQLRRSGKSLPLTAPTKVVSAPFIIQPWGTGAWNVMLRRTDMLFRTEDAFNGQEAELLGHAKIDVAALAGLQ